MIHGHACKLLLDCTKLVNATTKLHSVGCMLHLVGKKCMTVISETKQPKTNVNVWSKEKCVNVSKSEPELRNSLFSFP